MGPGLAPLPHASIATIIGLLDHLEHTAAHREDVYKLGGPLGFELDDLLPVTEAAKKLGLVTITGGDITLTAEGLTVAQGSEELRKKRLRRKVEKLPLVARIRRALVSESTGRVARKDLLEPLEEQFSPMEASRQLQTALEWARYTGLFDFDADAEDFVLPE